jgi:hypothetical protein
MSDNPQHTPWRNLKQRENEAKKGRSDEANQPEQPNIQHAPSVNNRRRQMLKPAYRRRDGCTTFRLSEAHRAMLEVESGISPEIAAERRYRTVSRAEVARGQAAAKLTDRAGRCFYPFVRPAHSLRL